MLAARWNEAQRLDVRTTYTGRFAIEKLADCRANLYVGRVVTRRASPTSRSKSTPFKVRILGSVSVPADTWPCNTFSSVKEPVPGVAVEPNAVITLKWGGGVFTVPPKIEREICGDPLNPGAVNLERLKQLWCAAQGDNFEHVIDASLDVGTLVVSNGKKQQLPDKYQVVTIVGYVGNDTWAVRKQTEKTHRTSDLKLLEPGYVVALRDGKLAGTQGIVEAANLENKKLGIRVENRLLVDVNRVNLVGGTFVDAASVCV